ncbi:ribonuclease HII [Sporolactobacillus vineae]|uniref:ribonuclease HII n=1 Tax=Sporolactobacillus vineae TaxID=444463 RepID=UPI000287DAA9|nr:ribonuclease HII [Sporolactobacillus vineae]
MSGPSIAEIRKQLEQVDFLSDETRRKLNSDSRKGVRHLLEIWDRRQHRRQALIDRFHKMNHFENDLYQKGIRQVAGIDEAGRGPLAGPVIAACVMLDPDAVLPGVNDSKQLTAPERDRLFDQIVASASAYGIGRVSARDIDRINIYEAARLAMTRAFEHMARHPEFLLIDAMKLPVSVPQLSLIKGDARSNSVAAASILAKVTRDRLMNDLDQRYPEYGFAGNKGYGTPQHLAALKTYGACPEHRLSFSPVAAVIRTEDRR